MQSSFRFSGGSCRLREKGEMFDSKTSKKTTWDKSLTILVDGQKVNVGQDFLVKLATLVEDPEFTEWSKDMIS